MTEVPVRPNYIDAEWDRQYDNRTAVPDHPRIFEQWAARSAATRSRFPARLDVAYGPAPRERLDFFPCASTDSPLHLFVHGGYWQALDKSFFSFVAESLTPLGVNVAVVTHTLCPGITVTGIVEQIRSAFVWLWRRAEQLGFDRERMQVSGHSAGGHLAAMLMATDWSQRDRNLPAEAIDSAVAISGLFDLEPLLHTRVNEAVRMDQDEARANSPVLLPPPRKVPMLLLVGGDESAEYHRQSEQLAESWSSRGMSIEYQEIPETNHFNVLDAAFSADGPLTSWARQRLLR